MKPNLYRVPLTITVDAAGFIQHPTIEVSVLAYNEEEGSLSSYGEYESSVS